MKRILSLAILLALTGPSIATAQSAQSELTPEHFAALNGKNSGGVSQEEYEQLIREAFKKLDVDGSGSLSRAETANVLPAHKFTALDQDKNDELSLDELINQLTRDSNGQGGQQDDRTKP